MNLQLPNYSSRFCLFAIFLYNIFSLSLSLFVGGAAHGGWENEDFAGTPQGQYQGISAPPSADPCGLPIYWYVIYTILASYLFRIFCGIFLARVQFVERC